MRTLIIAAALSAAALSCGPQPEYRYDRTKTPPWGPAFDASKVDYERDWWCYQFVDEPEVTSCSQTRDECEMAFDGLRAKGSQVTSCKRQEGAACFTYWNGVWKTTDLSCAASASSCAQHRTYTANRYRVSMVSECTAVGPLPPAPIVDAGAIDASGASSPDAGAPSDALEQ